MGSNIHLTNENRHGNKHNKDLPAKQQNKRKKYVGYQHKWFYFYSRIC